MQRKGDSIKPYIKDDSGKEGWDVIKPQLEEAKAGDTVTVAMNGTTVVPKDVIDSIKGKDTTLVLVLYALKDFLIKRLGSLLEHTT